jgi:hypothetical protein
MLQVESGTGAGSWHTPAVQVPEQDRLQPPQWYVLVSGSAITSPLTRTVSADPDEEPTQRARQA